MYKSLELSLRKFNSSILYLYNDQLCLYIIIVYIGAEIPCCVINNQPLIFNKEDLYNHRKLSELPYSLAKLGNLKELQEVVCEWEWMMSKIAAMTCEDYVADFAPLVPTVSQ